MMQSALIQLLAVRKGPEEGSLLPKGPVNVEPGNGRPFSEILGALDTDGVGLPGARNFPGEFQFPVAAPMEAMSEPQMALSTLAQPSSSEYVRDAGSYFYAAGMESNAYRPDRPDATMDPAGMRESPEQCPPVDNKAAEYQSQKPSEEKPGSADDKEGAQPRLNEKEQTDSTVRSNKEDGAHARKSDGTEQSRQTEDSKKQSTVRNDAETNAAQKVSDADKEKQLIRKKIEEAMGSIAGISESREKKPEQVGEKVLDQILAALAQQVKAEKTDSQQQTKSAAEDKGLLQRMTSLDSDVIDKIKDFFKNHPELEKAAQSVRNEKDLQAFIKRLSEELPAKDLNQLRDLIQKTAPIEQLANGNVRINSEKWTVDGPVLSSQMKVQTEEKTSTQSNSKGGGDQQKSDNQLNLRMDSTILAQKSRASATANEAPAFDRKQFQEMVEQARVRLSPDGKSTASIRMNPENLGRMHLDLVMKDNVLSGRLVVENHAAFKHIKDEIEGLRSELARHGITLEGLSVKTRETVQSQMGHQLRQDMQGQGFSPGSENGGDPKNGSENPADSEKYSSGSENRWEERVIADVSESLLSAIPAGRVDLSV